MTQTFDEEPIFAPLMENRERDLWVSAQAALDPEELERYAANMHRASKKRRSAMSKATSLEFGVTLSKNYQSVKVGITVALNEEDDPEVVLDQIKKTVYALAKEEQEKL